MQVTINKWGNSAGVRLNKTLLEKANLNIGDTINIDLRDDTLVMFLDKSADKEDLSIEEMYSMMDKNNLHHEIDGNNLVGNEDINWQWHE